MTGKLIAEPGSLISAARSFEEDAGDIGRLTANMLAELESLESSWTGEAASSYYRKAKSLQPGILAMVRAVREHADGLREMAAACEDTVTESPDIPERLNPGLII